MNNELSCSQNAVASLVTVDWTRTILLGSTERSFRKAHSNIPKLKWWLLCRGNKTFYLTEKSATNGHRRHATGSARKRWKTWTVRTFKRRVCPQTMHVLYPGIVQESRSSTRVLVSRSQTLLQCESLATRDYCAPATDRPDSFQTCQTFYRVSNLTKFL